jgi:hypothetical protein
MLPGNNLGWVPPSQAGTRSSYKGPSTNAGSQLSNSAPRGHLAVFLETSLVATAGGRRVVLVFCGQRPGMLLSTGGGQSLQGCAVPMARHIPFPATTRTLWVPSLLAQSLKARTLQRGQAERLSICLC